MSIFLKNSIQIRKHCFNKIHEKVINYISVKFFYDLKAIFDVKCLIVSVGNHNMRVRDMNLINLEMVANIS